METRRLDKGMLIGVLLVGFGALFLLQQFGFFSFMVKTLWGLGFIGGGAVFLSLFLNDKRQWWALFPAAALACTGLSIILPGGGMIGALWLGGLGAAFLMIHVAYRNWVWPIIPGGVLLSIAALVAFETLTFHWFNGASIMFFGWAATFVAVWYQSTDRHYYSWALIVAAVLGFVGVIILTASVMATMFKIVVPVGLILLGVYSLTDGRLFKR